MLSLLGIKVKGDTHLMRLLLCSWRLLHVILHLWEGGKGGFTGSFFLGVPMAINMHFIYFVRSLAYISGDIPRNLQVRWVDDIV
jgi:hypothetical protein